MILSNYRLSGIVWNVFNYVSFYVLRTSQIRVFTSCHFDEYSNFLCMYFTLIRTLYLHKWQLCK